jgi:putative ABC transport system substrate-binding protein
MGLARLGYREGDTIQYELRVADSSQTRLAEMAADLVSRNVDVIVAATTPAVLAAKAATSSIPIVMSPAADPVGSGFVASLSRPGGNITGGDAALAELSATMIGFLREGLPPATRMGLVLNSSDPFHRRLRAAVEIASQSIANDLRIFEVPKPSDMERAFDRMAGDGVGGAIVQPTLPRQQGIELASRRKIATCSPVLGYAHQGGFMSYSGSASDVSNIATDYIDRILRGAKPAEIPVRQPAQFDLVLNLKTARALGLEVPALLLAKATDLVE